MPVYGKDWQVRYCPVQPQQITAAISLYSDHLLSQVRTDRALASLAELLPDCDSRGNSLKMVALDSLYEIRHPAIDAYVERVEEYSDWPGDKYDLVERLTGGHTYGGEEIDWRLASGFAHWFVDDSMPIYDRWARRGLKLHYQRIERRWSVYGGYRLFVTLLRGESGLSCSMRDFCLYLRLTGMQDLWLRRPSRHGLGFGGEVRQLFESNKRDVKTHLKLLVPQP